MLLHGIYINFAEEGFILTLGYVWRETGNGNPQNQQT